MGDASAEAYKRWAQKAAQAGIDVFSDPAWAGHGIVSREDINVTYPVNTSPEPPYTGYTPQVMEAGVGALLPWLLKAVGGILPTSWSGLLGGAAAGVGLGMLADGSNNNQSIVGGNIPLSGPGLPEPPNWMVAKQWKVNNAQFYKLIDGRIAVYSFKRRTWKVYRPAKHIVIPRDPKASQLIRADKKIDTLMTRLAKRAGFTRKRTTSRNKGRVAVPQGYQIINID